MKRSWMTHQLVTQAAAILLREALKYDVELLAPEHGTAQDLEQIAAGRRPHIRSMIYAIYA